MKRMRITVTEEDIERAKWQIASSEYFRVTTCPIAQALRRRGFSKVKVYGRQAEVVEPNDPRLKCWNLSEGAVNFIELFDDFQDRVGPATFYLTREY